MSFSFELIQGIYPCRFSGLRPQVLTHQLRPNRTWLAPKKTEKTTTSRVTGTKRVPPIIVSPSTCQSGHSHVTQSDDSQLFSNLCLIPVWTSIRWIVSEFHARTPRPMTIRSAPWWKGLSKRRDRSSPPQLMLMLVVPGSNERPWPSA